MRLYIRACASAGSMPGMPAHGTPGSAGPCGMMFRAVPACAGATAAPSKHAASARARRIERFSSCCGTDAAQGVAARGTYRFLKTRGSLLRRTLGALVRVAAADEHRLGALPLEVAVDHPRA